MTTIGHNTDMMTHVGNAVSVAAVPVIWAGVLPDVLQVTATLFTIIWMGLQIVAQVKVHLDNRFLARSSKDEKGDQYDHGKE